MEQHSLGQRGGPFTAALLALALATLAGSCKPKALPTTEPPPGTFTHGDAGAKPSPMQLTPVEAHAKWPTQLHVKLNDRKDPPVPPKAIFDLVHYPAPLGENAAYVSPMRAGAKRPAIVWIVGGYDPSIDEELWGPRRSEE